MPTTKIRLCQCSLCQQEGENPTKKHHRMINLMVNQLNEQQRRWFVALEANQTGRGGIRLMSQITGMDEKTIHRGLQELEKELTGRPKDRVRLEGGGRPLTENRMPR